MVPGWRGRIGVIFPDDGLNDDEYWLYAPRGISVAFTRYTTPAAGQPVTIDTMRGTYDDVGIIIEASRTLRMPRPTAVVFACNSCSFLAGPEMAPRLDEALTQAMGVPATTTTSAEVAALRALGVSRVAIAAPYVKEISDLLGEVLEDRGFRVVKVCSSGMLSEWEIGNTDHGVWYRLAMDAARGSDAEAVVLACTGIRTAEIVDTLEADLQLPVVSAPAVSMWHPLRLAGIRDQLPNRGRLFRSY